MHLLIFDFDGVMADTYADMLRFAQETCDELGVAHKVVPSDLSDLEVMSFATFGRACEVPEDKLGEFVHKCTDKFAGKETPPAIFDGLTGVIRGLVEKNVLLIVSGNTAGNVKAFLAYHGLDDCFHEVYGVDSPGTKAEKLRMAQTTFESNSVYFVGDSLSDIRAAKEAGVKSVAVGWGHQSLELLANGSPEAIVHSPQELASIFGAGG